MPLGQAKSGMQCLQYFAFTYIYGSNLIYLVSSPQVYGSNSILLVSPPQIKRSVFSRLWVNHVVYLDMRDFTYKGQKFIPLFIPMMIPTAPRIINDFQLCIQGKPRHCIISHAAVSCENFSKRQSIAYCILFT